MKSRIIKLLCLVVVLLSSFCYSLGFAETRNNSTYEQAKKAVEAGKQSTASSQSAADNKQPKAPAKTPEVDAKKEAERIRKEVIAKSEKPEVYMARGLVFDGMKEYRNAIANYDFAIYLNPKLWQAYYYRAADKRILGEYDSALNDLEQVAALNAKYADAYYLRGLIFNDTGEYTRALVEFDKADSMSIALKGPAQIGSGIANYYLKQFEAAKKNFEAAIAANASSSEGYVWLGRLYADTRNYKEALNCYNKAIALNPQDSVAYLFKGRTLAFFMKNYEEGIVAFTKAIEINPDYADAYLQRAYAYNQKGIGKLAKADFDKAVELNPYLKEQVLPAYRGDGKGAATTETKADSKRVVVTANG